MKSSLVHVRATTHLLLKQIAQHQRRPIPEVLDDAVERYRRFHLFEVADVAYRRDGARKNRDLAAWQNALEDGLPGP